MTNFTLKILPALIVAVAATLLAQPVCANTIPTLTLTEVSNTELDYSWSTGQSGSLTTLTPDAWALTNINGPDVGITVFTNANTWQEPENVAGLRNIVGIGYSNTGTGPFWNLTVTSDATGFGITPDGQPFSPPGSPISVTFNDKGDVATAPDTGTTASLFGLSLTGLAFFRRKLS